MKIPAEEALRNGKKPVADWPVARRKIRSGLAFPDFQPSFSLSPDDMIFTMGSCFARNIEQHLSHIGCDVPAHRFSTPAHERKGPAHNHVLTLFTPPTFLQEIEWVEKIYLRDGVVTASDCEPLLFPMADGKVVDLALAGSTPVTMERMIQRRQEIYDLYTKAFTADCVIMTPGLIEAWYDRKYNRYTNAGPLLNGESLDPGRYELHVLDHAECLEYLSKTIGIIRKHNPKTKILITVSPVPLRRTFSGQDIITANTYSKSVLRAVCNELVSSGKLIDYFPSYEAVTLSTKNVWEKDRRHVTDFFIARIVSNLSRKYFPGSHSGTEDTSYDLSLSQKLLRFFSASSPVFNRGKRG